MKIRNGFVSNSSSSSFIISLLEKKNEPCPHCGRKDPDFLELVENSSYGCETSVDYDSKESILELIKEDLKGWESELADACLFDDVQIWRDTSWRQITYGDRKKSLREDIKRLQKKYNDIQAAQGKVVQVSIGYGDSALLDILNQMEANGTAVIVEKEEG